MCSRYAHTLIRSPRRGRGSMHMYDLCTPMMSTYYCTAVIVSQPSHFLIQLSASICSDYALRGPVRTWALQGLSKTVRGLIPFGKFSCPERQQ